MGSQKQTEGPVTGVEVRMPLAITGLSDTLLGTHVEPLGLSVPG